MQRVLVHYAIAFVIAQIAVLVIGEILYALAEFDLGGWTGFVIALLAAQYAGTRHGRICDEPPTNAFCWQVAAAMTVVGWVINLISIAIIVMIWGTEEVVGGLMTLLDGEMLAILGVGLAIVSVLMLLIHFFTFRSAARKTAGTVSPEVFD